MKKLYSLMVIIAMAINVFAQSPQKMSYQCVLRNTSGVLVTNQVVGIKISILQGSTNGTAVYTETLTPTTNANGLVSIEIGGGTGFDLINWAEGPYFLKTETDPAGGTDYTISGTSQLLSVPYALYAKSAENGFSGNYNDLSNKPTLFSGSYIDLANKPELFSGNYNDLTNKPVLFEGTWTSLIGKPSTLSGYGITDGMSTSHVANGITAANITNWNTAFGWGNHAGLYRPLSYVPSWSEITTKPTTVTGYGITDAVTTSGDQTIAGNKTFIGIINASNKRITSVGDPVSNQDAVTKAYINVMATAIDDKIDNKFDQLKAYIKTLEDNLIDAGIYKFTDIDGNQYNYIKIGTQIWMAENLRTTKFNDGTAIPSEGEMGMPTYCWYNNDEATYKDTYGALYNWWAVFESGGKLCPTNWHVPTDDEWTTMENYLIANHYNYDGTTTGNKIAKSLAAATGWRSSSTSGAVGNTDYPTKRNLTGFTALPGGYCPMHNNFDYILERGMWWSSTDATRPWHRVIYFNYSYVGRENNLTKESCLSVRCVRD